MELMIQNQQTQLKRSQAIQTLLQQHAHIPHILALLLKRQ